MHAATEMAATSAPNVPAGQGLQLLRVITVDPDSQELAAAAAAADQDPESSNTTSSTITQYRPGVQSEQGVEPAVLDRPAVQV